MGKSLFTIQSEIYQILDEIYEMMEKLLLNLKKS